MSLASRKLRFHLAFTSLLVVIALLVTWLLLGESSPFHNYLIRNSELPNVWAMTTAVPYIFSALITGNPHSPSMVIFMIALIIQWALIGFLLSIPMAKLFGRLQKK